jgi:hypothetical protein
LVSVSAFPQRINLSRATIFLMSAPAGSALQIDKRGEIKVRATFSTRELSNRFPGIMEHVYAVEIEALRIRFGIPAPQDG